VSLADVLKDSLSAVSAQPNWLALPPVDGAIVLLVDGLGADALRSFSGHARTLAAGLTRSAVIESGFPTTTAAALATLTTGLRPGEHGLVGYSVLDAAHDRVVNQLSGWDDRLDPMTWQRGVTVFEQAHARGVPASAVGPGRYRATGFTVAVLRGADYVAAETIADRLARAGELARSGGIVYVYVPELDMASHAHGGESPQWIRALETVDAAVRTLEAALPRRVGLMVTADHGALDVPQSAHVLIDQERQLLDGIRFVAGEPRALQLHIEPEANAQQRDRILDAWRAAESDRAWVVSRADAIEADWFGPVAPEVEPRIGDIIVAARKRIAYYDGRTATDKARAMVGQHGSWSPGELRVPLLRFGAFAR
jgi:predicted AlkP superfamily pyrophosphatase or phosphodiesterase